MFNFGGTAKEDVADEAFALGTNTTSAPVTLSESVHRLFEQLRVPVFRYVMRKTRDFGRAEEITQETFLRLFRHLKEERLVGNPKAWLFTVANILPLMPAAVTATFRILMKLHGAELKTCGWEPPTPKSSLSSVSVWNGCGWLC